MATGAEASKTEVRALLGVRKASRAAPILLLLATALVFIVVSLPSATSQLGVNLGLTKSAGETLPFDKLVELIETEEGAKKVKAAFDDAKGWDVFGKFFQPMVKGYLDELSKDFYEIIASFVVTAGQLALYSLVPGIAGLIYRRHFWSWFLASFVVLMAINASGIFGSISSARQMPFSGQIFFFLASQVVVLMLANRLRRHARVSQLLPKGVHNWGLAAILVMVGVACFFGWGPGYSDGSRPAAASGAAAVSQPAAPVRPATGADAGEQRSSGEATGAPAPAAAPTPPVAAHAQRSWIWSVFGTGLSGLIYKWEFILIGLPLIYTLLRNSNAWTGRAPKNIVFCLDGTSNTPDQYEMGVLAQTNVFKLFRMLTADQSRSVAPEGQFDATLLRRHGDKQIAFYYTGVGNKYDNDPILQAVGQATGLGAGSVVERAYLDLVRVYQPGDRVFIFGFSRGAAIARMLARTIDLRGAPRSVWTLRLFGGHWPIWRSRSSQPVAVDVLGCWDTVGSFGVAKTIAGINFQQMNMFADLTVPDSVRRAYHLVALDEMRDSFEPTLMDADPLRPERIVEVWFSGDHANIGGGWATDRLSDLTLDFMLRHVSSGYDHDGTRQPGNDDWGLYLSAVNGENPAASAKASDGVTVINPDPMGQIRSWHSNLYTYRPRKLPLDAVISEAVFERMTKAQPVYAPQSLFDHNDALDAKRDLIDEKLNKLLETQSISESEREGVLAAKNKLRLTRWPAYWQAIVDKRSPEPPRQHLANRV